MNLLQACILIPATIAIALTFENHSHRLLQDPHPHRNKANKHGFRSDSSRRRNLLHSSHFYQQSERGPQRRNSRLVFEDPEERNFQATLNSKKRRCLKSEEPSHRSYDRQRGHTPIQASTTSQISEDICCCCQDINIEARPPRGGTTFDAVTPREIFLQAVICLKALKYK